MKPRGREDWEECDWLGRKQRIPVHRIERISESLTNHEGDRLLHSVTDPRLDSYRELLWISPSFYLSAVSVNSLRRLDFRDGKAILLTTGPTGNVEAIPCVKREGIECEDGSILIALTVLLNESARVSEIEDLRRYGYSHTRQMYRSKIQLSQLTVSDYKEVNRQPLSHLPGEEIDL
jgi:hypothetical protein